MTQNHLKILLRMVILAGLLAGLGSALPGKTAEATLIYASPVHAGCYLARSDRCRIHVEPFTISLVSGTKLVQFRLMATRTRNGAQTVIYNFRPDVSNPLPYSGSTITPSLVAKDFAAMCGETYTISLQGQDTGDIGLYNLGTTGQFTCPTGSYKMFLPEVGK